MTHADIVVFTVEILALILKICFAFVMLTQVQNRSIEDLNFKAEHLRKL